MKLYKIDNHNYLSKDYMVLFTDNFDPLIGLDNNKYDNYLKQIDEKNGVIVDLPHLPKSIKIKTHNIINNKKNLYQEVFVILTAFPDRYVVKMEYVSPEKPIQFKTFVIDKFNIDWFVYKDIINDNLTSYDFVRLCDKNGEYKDMSINEALKLLTSLKL